MIVLRIKYPLVSLRIICLTDGEDNASTNAPFPTSKYLVDQHITVDSIMLSVNCQDLKSLCFSTGGFSFSFSTKEEGFALFESDSFLSLNFRRQPYILAQDTIEEFKSAAEASFTQIPPPIKYPDQTCSRVQDIKKALLRVQIAKPTFSSAVISNRFKRIMRELATITKNPHPEIKIYPCENDLEFWKR